MWLSGLHIPESYLTALVQATCRKNGWPLDKSTLYTAVTEVHCNYYNTYYLGLSLSLSLSLQHTNPDQVTERAPSGCYITGLYLEGACWDLDKKCLIKSPPKVLIEELPILRIIPIEAHRLKLVVQNDSYTLQPLL